VERPFYLTWCEQNTDQYFHLKSGSGHTLITEQGKEVTDLSSLTFHASFGLSNKLLIDKIKHQLDQFPVPFSKGLYPLKTEVTKRFLDFLGLPGKIFYTVSGAESVENALKMARYLKKGNIILARKKSYHGATLGALSITDDWRTKNHFLVNDKTIIIPEPHEDPEGVKTRELIKKVGAKNIAAFCLESFAITRGNEHPIPEKSWWENIEKICKENKIFLILDEVTCGFYRTGKPFGLNHYNLKPDMVCMAKSLSGGMIPFGALYTSMEIAKGFDDQILSFGLTQTANPLGLAALEGVLDFLTNDSFILNLKNLEKVLVAKMRDLNKLENVTGTHAIGLLAAIKINTKMTWKDFLEKGLNIYRTKDKIILAPGFTFSPEKLELALNKLEEILRSES